MTNRYDVVSSRKDKDGKFRSTKIGAAFVKDDRISVVLDALPIGNSEGQAWLTLFPAKPKEGKQADASSAETMDDSIPF
ncbi:hypothetical protein [Bradyrhizobium sp. Leo121]|uniref:hypothetical protein n=1 Tax=Bradyrhizobium sp. Leo121 TaxID=1571195 RepID=UPI00102A93A6|nr:hypothetical protein [Bradyrhizobium sp. Leo121]RZN19495.1 hypothetical protein CWO90_35280 [Bradyrhizobium sp. Leo121]